MSEAQKEFYHQIMGVILYIQYKDYRLQQHLKEAFVGLAKEEAFLKIIQRYCYFRE